MKIKDTSALEDLLKRFQRLIRAAKKASDEFDTVRADIETFDAKIAAIGEPNYNDDAKFAELQLLKQKRETASKALETIVRERIGRAVVALDRMNPAVGKEAFGILMSLLNVRLETIARSVLIFCADSREAHLIARRTTCYMSALAQINEFRPNTVVRPYTGILQGQPESEQEYFVEVSWDYEEVMRKATFLADFLEEASKKTPDLMRYLPFSPARAEDFVPEAASPTPTSIYLAGTEPKSDTADDAN